MNPERLFWLLQAPRLAKEAPAGPLPPDRALVVPSGRWLVVEVVLEGRRFWVGSRRLEALGRELDRAVLEGSAPGCPNCEASSGKAALVPIG